MINKFNLLIGWGIVSCGLAFAQAPVTIIGITPQSIPTTVKKSPNRSLQLQAHRPRNKRVVLLKFSLTGQTKKNLAQQIEGLMSQSQNAPTVEYSLRHIQLGMNHVPVLDQGEHGTCMLFASTAALDAVLDKGDYVSQLCQLDLSQYLQHNAYSKSGWEGGWGEDFLTQIRTFGIIPKSVQLMGGCLGRTQYPLDEDIKDELSVFDFHQMSESIQDYNIAFVPLVLPEQINQNFVDRERIFSQIKKTLRQGNRVIGSVLLMGFEPGIMLPSASYHVMNDTWVLWPYMANALLSEEPDIEGHAFVITGYDDEAVAVDANGQFHRGLLTLRNSWGATVGDHGDFYMSYSYFKAMLLEAHQIKQTRKINFHSV